MPVSNLSLALKAEAQSQLEAQMSGLSINSKTRPMHLFNIPNEILHHIFVLAAPQARFNVTDALNMLKAPTTCKKFSDLLGKIAEIDTNQSMPAIQEHLKAHYIKIQNIGTKPQVTSADLTEQDLTAISLPRTEMPKIKVSNSEMSHGRFDKSNLDQSVISNTNFKLVSFNETKARLTTWTNVNLQGAQAAGAFFTGSTLKQFQAQFADLRDTNFKSTKMADANLEGADLRGADLRGADLSMANLNNTLIDTFTRIDEKTKLPQGFEPKRNLATETRITQHQAQKEAFLEDSGLKNRITQEIKAQAGVSRLTTPSGTQPINIPMRNSRG